MVVMESSAKGIGHQLRRIFTGVVRRPMGWRLIDALGRLEDKEEALRSDEEIYNGDQDEDHRKAVD
jgi:hypothetical protein